LFAGFTASTAESDFPRPCIIGYGSPAYVGSILVAGTLTPLVLKIISVAPQRASLVRFHEWQATSNAPAIIWRTRCGHEN
jgi:hypothetical protein